MSVVGCCDMADIPVPCLVYARSSYDVKQFFTSSFAYTASSDDVAEIEVLIRLKINQWS